MNPTDPFENRPPPDESVDPLADSRVLPAESVAGPAAGSGRQPRVWTVFCVFVVAIVLYVFTSALALLVAGVALQRGPLNTAADFENAIEGSMDHPVAMLVAILVSGLMLTVISLIAAIVSPVAWRERLNLRRPQITVGGMLAAIISTLCVGAAVIGLDGLGWLPKSDTLEVLTDLIAALHGPLLFAGLLLIGVLPGIAEELLFRGYVQTRLVQRWGVHLGVWIAAILFGLMHFDLTQGSFAFGIGVILGYITVWSRSIVPAMICHATNNSLSVLLTVYASRLDQVNGVGNSVALIAGSCLTAVLCLTYLRNAGSAGPVAEETRPSLA